MWVVQLTMLVIWATRMFFPEDVNLHFCHLIVVSLSIEK